MPRVVERHSAQQEATPFPPDYRWCIDRFRGVLSHVDLIRLDYFRGFAAARHIPSGAATAPTGSWQPGPEAEFFRTVGTELGGLPVIAEDLGLITPDAGTNRDQFHIPGTRVLQFAFDGHEDNPHLPQTFINNTVVNSSTHDNSISRQWFAELNKSQQTIVFSKSVDGSTDGTIEPDPTVMGLAWSLRAALAIAQLRDRLDLGQEARMNMPSHAAGNWCGRGTDEQMFVDEPFARLLALTGNSNRLTDADVLGTGEGCRTAFSSAETNRRPWGEVE